MSYTDKTLTFESDKIYYTDISFGGDFEVMMDWEDPLMSASAAYVCENGGDILEIGFGMGISAGYMHSHSISTHTIIENHPNIIPKAQAWALNKSNVTVITGSWYDVKDSLSTYDGIFYDTFGDENMKNFSSSLSVLTKSNTKVTWWNNNTDETNFYSIPNVTYQAVTIDPPTNSYFNSTTYYLPKKQF
jgi:protein arginine N-methyltransferase 2